MHSSHAFIACIHCMHASGAFIACINCMHSLHIPIACNYSSHACIARIHRTPKQENPQMIVPARTASPENAGEPQNILRERRGNPGEPRGNLRTAHFPRDLRRGTHPRLRQLEPSRCKHRWGKKLSLKTLFEKSLLKKNFI